MDTETMNKAAEQASTVARALPYPRRYSGATIVVKYGGHAMSEEHLAVDFGKDIALLKQVGINPVIVHGGGPQINTMLERLEIKSTFVDGLRITDHDDDFIRGTLTLATGEREVLAGARRGILLADRVDQHGDAALVIAGEEGPARLRQALLPPLLTGPGAVVGTWSHCRFTFRAFPPPSYTCTDVE